MKDTRVIIKIDAVVAEQTSQALQHGGRNSAENWDAQGNNQQDDDITAR